MKTMRVIPVTLALLFTVQCALGAKGRLTKTFDREFAVREATALYIENKYGQINVENWSKDLISIRVEVKVDNPSDEKAKIMLDAIDVEFSEAGNVVSAITRFNKDIMKANKRLFSSISSDEMTIDYLIKMPKHVEVELRNRYGDIFINELSGKLLVNLRYGNIRVNRLERDDSGSLNTLSVAYGGATIGEAGWLKVDIKYGNLKIEKARATVLVSKYSNVSIDNANSVVTDSKYDTYTLGSVANIVGESGYTNFSIGRLDKRLSLISKYGDVKVASVSAGFESIVFNGVYTGLKAAISPNASYRVDAAVSYGNINLDPASSRISRIEHKTSMEVSGIVGTQENPSSTVYVRVKYGNVSLTN